MYELLREAADYLVSRGVSAARREVEILLGEILGLDRARLYARESEDISVCERQSFDVLLRRRAGGEPLGYVLGYAEFMSLVFRVTPATLIPRPETEILTEALLEKCRRGLGEGRVHIVDLGTGCGNIAVSAAVALRGMGYSPRNCSIVATDISSAALSIAEENAWAHDVQDMVTFRHGNWFAPLADVPGMAQADFLVSNPPYVSGPEIARLQREVRDFEPRLAIEGGRDGQDFEKVLIDEGHAYTRRGGWVMLEMGAGHAAALSERARGKGHYGVQETLRDLAGVERVLCLEKS